MDLPDCPPGAEGYHDTVTEVAKRPGLELDGISSTKAEKEFLEHLNSLKIQLENGAVRCMVERRGRDVAGKWVYLCYPCAAICSGEPILQIHLSGKKHKLKLGSRQVWPVEIFDDHPHMLTYKQQKVEDIKEPNKVPVEVHDQSPEFAELEAKYSKFKNQECEIQKVLDKLKITLIGVEYLVEFPPEEDHHERRYLCILCNKQGHPRTIINHLTCFWHQFSYFKLHFQKAATVLAPYCRNHLYRPGVTVVMSQLAKRIEDKFGRLKPLLIDSDTYEKEKAAIGQWVSRSYHLSEKSGTTFEEVVDIGLITSLSDPKPENKDNTKRDPSPPVTAPPVRPTPKNNAGGAGARGAGGAGKGRAASTEPISDDSDVEHVETTRLQSRPTYRERAKGPRYSPYKVRRRGASPPVYRTRYGSPVMRSKKSYRMERSRPPNYEHKVKLCSEKVKSAEESAKKTLLYHEKNPEKHPLYPEEWKKFWNKRYKEIQTEGKDPMKHDFKPEWIVYWTNRMKELHEQELRLVVNEIYRKLCLTPPPDSNVAEATRKSPQRRSPTRRSPPRRSPARRSPARRSPPRRSPARRSPSRRSPARRSPARRSPARRSPARRPSPRRSPVRKLNLKHSRSRSPLSRHGARPHIELESLDRSQSPLSQRTNPLRNRSPAPALQTVLISDDELKDDEMSPWNSDSLESLGSLPDARSPVHSRSRAGSSVSHNSRSQKSSRMHKHSRGTVPLDVGPGDTVVATLRLLVALEDYMGSLGPKIVDLLTEALKMEKERPNSSDEMLDQPAAVALLETAKEKLKGAVQVGLVRASAVAAARGAIVRAATLLHQADRRAHDNKQKSLGDAAVAVAGVGAVDRAEIAAQMAAALVAQGKTDVSAEELAHLVDAVVGMAEAKKREAEVKKSFVSAPPPVLADISPKPPQVPKSRTALQLLQNAYDEYEKKVDKEDTADAMDGLSDSDLETLLKNFNELSAEEQHSLIGYLKKLEAREPKRVERLREYVSDAAPAPAPAPAPDAAPAPAAPPAAPLSAPAPSVASATAVVHLDSDDDEDYTVDDVLKSANLKVKEDQMRHEMEIVKKSLEEVKKTDSPPREAPTAANLLAIVQASLQSTLAPTAASAHALTTFTNENFMQQPPNTQSRSFDNPSVFSRGIQPTFNTHTRSYGDALENQQNQDYSRDNVSQQSFNSQDNSPTFSKDNASPQAPMQPISYSDSPQNQQSGDMYEFSSNDVPVQSTGQQFRSFDDSTYYNAMQQMPDIQSRSYGDVPRNGSNQDMSFNASQGSGPRHNFNAPQGSGPRQRFNAPRQPFGVSPRFNAPQGINTVSRNLSEYGGNSTTEPHWDKRQQTNITQDRYLGGAPETYERDFNYRNSIYQEGARGNYRPPHLRRGRFPRGRGRGGQY